jgi:hypothetical protein
MSESNYKICSGDQAIFDFVKQRKTFSASFFPHNFPQRASQLKHEQVSGFSKQRKIFPKVQDIVHYMCVHVGSREHGQVSGFAKQRK